MCWSGEASGVLAAVGLGTAYYIAKRGESKELSYYRKKLSAHTPSAITKSLFN